MVGVAVGILIVSSLVLLSSLVSDELSFCPFSSSFEASDEDASAVDFSERPAILYSRSSAISVTLNTF